MKHLLLFGMSLMMVMLPAAQWTPVAYPGFSVGTASYTSLALYNGVPYVAYRDGGNLNKAKVMKYNSTSNQWEVVGNSGFSPIPVFYTSLAFSNDGSALCG